MKESSFFFERFKTEYNRLNLYEKDSVYKAPDQFEVGETKVLATKTDTIDKKFYASRSSLKHSLKILLEQPGIYTSMMNHISHLQSERKIISNIIQAELWNGKYRRNGFEKKNIVPVFLYFDDCEVGNSLGSHSGEQKLGAVYVSLPCLPPQLVSKSSSMILTTIFYSYLRGKFGNYHVFKEDIEELNELSKTGLTLSIDGNDVVLYCACTLFLGDNLGINQVCGFSESFKATYYCKICRATSEQCNEMIEEDQTLLRNRSNYEYDVINDTAGVKEECILNSVNEFHVTENLSDDIMHTLLQGVAKDVIEKTLTILILVKKVFDLDTLNYRVESFPYNDTEKSNIPRRFRLENSTPIEEEILGAKSKVAVRQSASETACLCRYLNLMVGDLITDKNDEHWRLYRLVREMFRVLLAPRFVEADVSHLRSLIKSHHKLYKKLYGFLKPKAHFLVHIPRLMKLHDPMVHIWSMPFERHHTLLKNIAMSTSTSKNIPKTICLRNQLQLCYKKEMSKFIEKKSRFELLDDVVLGPIEKKPVADDIQLQVFKRKGHNCRLESISYVKILGHIFKENTVFFSS